MSLKVWLPLDGTLDNLGVSNYNITAFRGSVVYNNNGKIGQCFYSNGINTLKINNILPDIYNYSAYSLCAWAYVESNNTSHSGSGIISGGNWNSQLLNLSMSNWSTDHYTRLRISGTNWSRTYTYNFYKNIWYHIVVCDDGKHTYAYVNGILIGDTAASFLPTSIEGTDICIGGATYYSGMQFFGRINDVRIYDHCLSAAEVHEISQGLVLHYKLDTQYFKSGTNLVTDVTKGGQTTKLTDGRLGVVTSGTNADTYFTINLSESITNGTTYHFSCDASGISEGQFWNFPLGAQSNTSLPCKIYNGHNEFVFTANDINWGTNRLFMDDLNRPDWQHPATFYNFVLTKDAAYEIKDCSGYNHNGIVVRNLTTIENTPRYSTAMSFSNSAAIKYTNFNLGNIWSAGIWFYSPSTVTTNWGCLFAVNSNGGDADFKMNLYIQQSSGKLQFTANGQYDSTQSFTKDTWHHLMETFDGSTVSCYLDGVLIKTKTITNTELSRSNLVIGARSSSANGSTATGYVTAYMSDFRIYCTALSAADVKQLYEVGVKIDNNQGWHTFEYIDENSKETITKTGKTMGHNIIETYIPLYDKTIYTEPDGSKWIHIFHHNNPTNSKFNSPTTDWLLGKYIDADRWYDVDHAIYNSLSPYEFMVKQKTTSSAAETKYRWRQTANPLTATWTDVKPGTPTFITTTGYTNSSMGGLYIFKSGNLHMCIANGSNGNWFGGIGAASAYNGGIPGYPNTTVTDGYIDLYIRVYANAKIIKTIGINAANLIEL